MLHDELIGRRYEVENFYENELILRDLFTGKKIEIFLEDTGLGYGEGGYVEYLGMYAREVKT